MAPTEETNNHVHRELDCVVLLRDPPGAEIRAGEVGTVVCVYGRGALEVEFVADTGATRALRTLTVADVRPARAEDLRDPNFPPWAGTTSS